MMTIDNAKLIKQFLTNNNIIVCSIMGGEFFCNPDWIEIFNIIIPEMRSVRLVTNGDWNSDVAEVLQKYKSVMNVSISKDSYHNNKNVDRAVMLCEKFDLKFNVQTYDQGSEATIIPVGRSMFSYNNNFSFFQSYCNSKKYTILIDEIGNVFKCPFGIIQMTTISEYLDGGFDVKFKTFNQKFHKMFISSCGSCVKYMMFGKKG